MEEKLKDLKVEAYDCICQIEWFQQRLAQLNQEIQNILSEKEQPKTEVEK